MIKIVLAFALLFAAAACASPCDVSGNCTQAVEEEAEACEDEACCFEIEPEIAGESGQCTISVGN